MPDATRNAVLALLGACLVAGCGGQAKPPPAAPVCGSSTWVATWTADPSDNADLGMVDQTGRTIVSPHLGGELVRVRLSNRFGLAPVTFPAASIGLRAGSSGAALVPGSNRRLRFGGAASVTVPVGADVLSDPVALRVTPAGALAISLFASGATGPATEHPIGQQTSYYTGPGSGDHTGEDAGGAFTLPIAARYFVADVDVLKTAPVGVVVALGDSVTDGFGGPPDGDDRYPDFLARRLVAVGARLGTVNAGIGGNHVLSDGPMFSGPSALDRLERDVLEVPGVSDVIVLEGVNDIAERKAADQVIGGLREIVGRLHAAGLAVQLGTLTPFGGVRAAGPLDAAREAVNAWIRSGRSGADGTVDFDAAVRDPKHAQRMAPAFDSGDHLHPNGAGRRAMAAAVDLGALRAGVCRPA